MCRGNSLNSKYKSEQDISSHIDIYNISNLNKINKIKTKTNKRDSPQNKKNWKVGKQIVTGNNDDIESEKRVQWKVVKFLIKEIISGVHLLV